MGKGEARGVRDTRTVQCGHDTPPMCCRITPALFHTWALSSPPTHGCKTFLIEKALPCGVASIVHEAQALEPPLGIVLHALQLADAVLKVAQGGCMGG